MATDQQVRVRFAPSPTGYLHIGGARTALFNWLFARHHRGTYVLRIDDTDEKRSTEESMRQIYDSFRWLGLDWDEGATVGGPYGPYVQSERGEIYRKYVQKLIDSGNAYHCYCTPEELETMRKQAQAEKRPLSYNRKCLNLTDEGRKQLEAEGRKPVVRIKIPDAPTVVQDLILGESKFGPSALEDEVIVRSNGSPRYNLTSIVDDHEMNITHVIRSVEHLSNTPKQIVIAQALGFDLPQFAHAPLVCDSQGKKLSKRHHGDMIAVSQYREDGYLPEALLNFLVKLGWSYDDTQEIFSIDELIEKFDLDRVGKSNTIFNLKKLQWLNNHYVMERDLSARTDAVIPFLQRDGFLEAELSSERRAWLEQIVEAVGDRLNTLADITEQTSYFFTDDFSYDPQAVKKWWKGDTLIGTLEGVRDVLSTVEPFGLEEVESAVWAYTEAHEIKRVQVMQPLRVALTGKSFGPGLFEIIVLLGAEQVLERINRAVDHIKAGV
jgi:glutamyl-tRNA synthetase